MSDNRSRYKHNIRMWPKLVARRTQWSGPQRIDEVADYNLDGRTREQLSAPRVRGV